MSNLQPGRDFPSLPWDSPAPTPQDSNGTDTGDTASKSAETQPTDSVTRVSALLAQSESKADDAADGEAEAEKAEDESGEREGANDADAEDDGDVAEGAEDEQDGDDEPLFEIDGKPVNREEARLGYLREQDATVKWQKAAEVRREATAERDSYRSKVAEITKFLELVTPDQKATIARAQEVYKAETAKAFEAAVVETEETLREKVSEWVDEDRMSSDMKEIAKTVKETYGFTQGELDSTVDSRVILALRDATRYHRLIKEQAEVKKKVTKPDSDRVVRPRAKSRRSSKETAKSAQLEAAMNRHRQSGDTGAGVEAIKLLLDM